MRSGSCAICASVIQPLLAEAMQEHSLREVAKMFALKRSTLQTHWRFHRNGAAKPAAPRAEPEAPIAATSQEAPGNGGAPQPADIPATAPEPAPPNGGGHASAEERELVERLSAPAEAPAITVPPLEKIEAVPAGSPGVPSPASIGLANPSSTPSPARSPVKPDPLLCLSCGSRLAVYAMALRCNACGRTITRSR
jgi:hypothetical protein